MIHLKSLPCAEFSRIIDSRQEFLLVHDNDIREGDYIAINEIDINSHVTPPTGRSCIVAVDTVIEKHSGLQKGYRAISIKPCDLVRLPRFHKTELNLYPELGVPLVTTQEYEKRIEKATQ